MLKLIFKTFPEMDMPHVAGRFMSSRHIKEKNFRKHTKENNPPKIDKKG